MNPFKDSEQNWELIDKTILPSAYEQMAAAGQIVTRITGGDGTMFQKKVVFTFKDKISGKTKQTTESNP